MSVEQSGVCTNDLGSTAQTASDTVTEHMQNTRQQVAELVRLLLVHQTEIKKLLDESLHHKQTYSKFNLASSSFTVNRRSVYN